MGVIDRIKKDKPKFVDFELADKVESMEVPVHTRNKWVRIQNAIDALEWIKITTRDVDGKMVNVHDPEVDPDLEKEDEQELAIDKIDIDPDNDVAQIVRAMTAAQQAVIAPVLKALTDMHGLTIGNIQAQYNHVLDRMELMEQKNQEVLEQYTDLMKKSAKGEKDNGMNAQMMEFITKLGPSLAQNFLKLPGAGVAPEGGNPQPRPDAEPPEPPEMDPPDMEPNGSDFTD